MGIKMKLRPGSILFAAITLIWVSAIFGQENKAYEPLPPPESSQAAEDQDNKVDEASLTKEAQEQLQAGAERISLDLKGIDILEFFRILSKKMGVTIVPSRTVGGRINIFLNNLTLNDALDVILLSQDLTAERQGSIIRIMTSAEYEKLYGKQYNEKRKVKTIKLAFAKPSTVFNALGQLKSDIGKVIADEASGTLILIDIPEKIELMEQTAADLDKVPETEIFDLKYAKAADIKTHLSGAITTGPGEVFVDERSGKIVVSDLPDKMVKIRRMLKAFDEPSYQVFIEAEIVQINLNNEYQRQINWEAILTKLHNVDLVGTFPVSASFTPSPALDTDSFKAAVGTLASDNYNTTLKFLHTLGEAKILSSPRITVINNQEAKVLVGTREAYITSTQSQADTTTITSESVEFIDVGVKLSLTPTVNKDGFVTIKIKPEVSRVSDTITTTAGSRVPIVETSETETVVKVKDGVMIMIAGLIKDEKRDTSVGLPILSRIPVIGALFGSKANQDKRTELVIFLTPHLTKGDINTSAKQIQEAVSPDIMTDKMRQIIMEEKLRNIRSRAGNIFLQQVQEENQESDESVKSGSADDEVQDKIKGIKKRKGDL